MLITPCDSDGEKSSPRDIEEVCTGLIGKSGGLGGDSEAVKSQGMWGPEGEGSGDITGLGRLL